MRDLPSVLSFVRSVPWAIEEVQGRQVLDVLMWRASGHRRSAAEVEERTAADRVALAARRVGAEERQPTGSVVAVLPLWGVVAHRAHMVQDVSGPGGTSTELFGQAFRAALGDPQVSAIVLDVDSPGGSVAGVPELADAVFAARGEKRVLAVANSMAASAAYWIASQAAELWVTPSGEVGSIGVFAVHLDESARLDADGVKPTLVKAGRFKGELNNFSPLTEEAQAALQEQVDDGYEMFVRAVARARGATPREVRDGFGEGRTVTAKKAVSLGMADRVGTLEEAIAHAAGKGSGARGPRADEPGPTLLAAAHPEDLDLRERELGL